MKRISQLFCSVLFYSILFCPQISLAQPGNDGADIPGTSCPNLNRFKDHPLAQELLDYAVRIYPSGQMLLDPAKSEVYGTVEDLYTFLGVEPNTSFEMVMERVSAFDSEKTYSRFQQYHNNVVVVGGGYTVGSLGTTTGGNPCAQTQLFSFSPYIATGIDISTEPTIPSFQLEAILPHETGIDFELLITHNLINECEYHLAWKVNYTDNTPKIAWVDAHTGEILKIIDGFNNLNARTEIYGDPLLNIVDLVDRQDDNGTTFMESPDGGIRAFDFSSRPNCEITSLDEFSTDLIPSTNASTMWPVNIASLGLSQAFHVVTQVDAEFANLGVFFDEINVGIDCHDPNASAISSSTLEKAYILIGNTAGDANTFGVFDVVAHELGHVFLHDFIDSDKVTNGSLHEGIADMIGTTIESRIQTSEGGTTDWIMGDDVAAIPERDLTTPACFTTIMNSTSKHARSRALSHWFFLISEGDADADIPGLGIQTAMSIVIGSLMNLNMDADYNDLKNAVKLFVDANFETCDDAKLATDNAWLEICVTAHYPGCHFDIQGPDKICEEHFDDDSNNMVFTAIGEESGSQLRWTYPAGWSIVGNPTAGAYYGNSLIVTGIPQYSHYPRYFTLKVKNMTAASFQYDQFHTIKIEDCDGDDPDCNSNPVSIVNSYNDEIAALENQQKLESVIESEELQQVEIYTIVGQLVYSGPYQNFDRNTLEQSKIIVTVFYDETGKITQVKKEFVLK